MSTISIQNATTYDSGDPEHVLAGDPGDVVVNAAKTLAWMKRYGTGTTGWVPYVLRSAAADNLNSLRVLVSGEDYEFVQARSRGAVEYTQRTTVAAWSGTSTFTYDGEIRRCHRLVTLTANAIVTLGSTNRLNNDVLEIQLTAAETSADIRLLTVKDASGDVIWTARSSTAYVVGVFVFDGSDWIFSNERVSASIAPAVENAYVFPQSWDIGVAAEFHVELGPFSVAQTTRILTVLRGAAAPGTPRDIILPGGAVTGSTLTVRVMPCPDASEVTFRFWSLTNDSGSELTSFETATLDPEDDHAQALFTWNGSAWVLTGDLSYPAP